MGERRKCGKQGMDGNGGFFLEGLGCCFDVSLIRSRAGGLSIVGVNHKGLRKLGGKMWS